MDKIFKRLELYSKKYDWEILKYGFQVLLFNTISTLVIILVALLNNQFMYGIFFMLSFGVVRIAIGGYHCKTLWGCLLSMILLFIIVLLLSQFTFYICVLKVLAILLIVNFYRLKCNCLMIIYLVLYFVLFESVFFTPIFSGLLLAMLLYSKS